MIAADRISGLTVWQPMAYFISTGDKPLENRTFPPWDRLTHLAIHAGLKWHADHAKQIHEILGLDVPDKDDPRIVHGAVIAVVRVGVIYYPGDKVQDQDGARWFSGPFGWQFYDVKRLEPIPCKGAQGLWRLPPEVLAQINAQLEAR